MGNISSLDEPTSDIGVPLGRQLRVTDLKRYVDDTSGTLQVLNTGGGLVKYLGKESSLCKYIDDGTLKMKFFAGGEAGQVADIEFPGMGTRRYVVKAAKALREILVVSEEQIGLTLQGAWEAGIKKENLDYDIYLELNGGNADRVLRQGDSIILPSFAQECLTTTTTTFPNVADSNKTVRFPLGSYICQENSYSEYVNSLLAGELIRRGISINFINTFNFATCYRSKPPKSYIKRIEEKDENYVESKTEHPDIEDRLVVQYTFMEKIDGDLKNIIEKKQTSKAEAEVLFVQILHAIAVYQANYKLQHGDLHLGNVFYSNVTENLMWHDQHVEDAKYFSYKIGDTVLYLPAIKYIAKIADWGLSVKYSKPIVGDKTTLRNGYDQRDGDGPWIPNFYNETYDLLYVFGAMFDEYPNSKFFIAIGDWLIDDITELPNYRHSSNDRPILSKLLEAPLLGKTAADLLQNEEIMGAFMKLPPRNASVLELGTLEQIPKPKRRVAKSPKRKPRLTRSSKKISPAEISCAQLSNLTVSTLKERLAPLALSPTTLTLFTRNRVTGQTLVDIYEIDKFSSLKLPETDRAKLVEYVQRCTAV